jgi:hypothetical protein
VGFQKYFGQKIATLACTTHFMHSIVVLSANWQYSSIASTFIPYASMQNVAMHFWIEDKPNFFAQSHLCKKNKILITNNFEWFHFIFWLFIFFQCLKNFSLYTKEGAK